MMVKIYSLFFSDSYECSHFFFLFQRMDVSSDVRDVLKEIQDLEKEAGKHNQVSIHCDSLTNYSEQRCIILSHPTERIHYTGYLFILINMVSFRWRKIRYGWTLRNWRWNSRNQKTIPMQIYSLQRSGISHAVLTRNYIQIFTSRFVSLCVCIGSYSEKLYDVVYNYRCKMEGRSCIFDLVEKL